jgi:hypothetical protein
LTDAERAEVLPMRDAAPDARGIQQSLSEGEAREASWFEALAMVQIKRRGNGIARADREGRSLKP